MKIIKNGLKIDTTTSTRETDNSNEVKSEGKLVEVETDGWIDKHEPAKEDGEKQVSLRVGIQHRIGKEKKTKMENKEVNMVIKIYR